VGERLAQAARGKPFALLDDFSGGIGRPGADEQVKVVGLHGQFQDRPAVLLALVLDELAALLADVANEDRFASFGAPDQEVHDKVNPLFVALVVHTWTGDCNTPIDKRNNTGSSRKRLTTAVETAWIAAG
jgi:hypothetical protein